MSIAFQNIIILHNLNSKGAFYPDKEITNYSEYTLLRLWGPTRRNALLWPSEIFTSSHIPGAMRVAAIITRRRGKIIVRADLTRENKKCDQACRKTLALEQNMWDESRTFLKTNVWTWSWYRYLTVYRKTLCHVTRSWNFHVCSFNIFKDLYKESLVPLLTELKQNQDQDSLK